jgi:hypothetical protein
MNCDNIDCLARHEPNIPCWEIARRVKSYHNVSNTCRDCIVYLLQKETSGLSKKEVQEILRHRGYSAKLGTDYLACTLKTCTKGVEKWVF